MVHYIVVLMAAFGGNELRSLALKIDVLSAFDYFRSAKQRLIVLFSDFVAVSGCSGED